MSQIACQNVFLGYGGKNLVSDLSFSVDRGDYLCIVGENGTGKSTLMKTILRLQTPLSGSITLGDDLKQSEIGYLPQQTSSQKDFPASVREIVLSGCLNRCGIRPFYSYEEKEIAAISMQKMGIKNLSESCYRELSGGQQQRVLLARALCATRKALLLDEPVSGLDPTAAADMYEIIYELNRHDGITIIMITHDIRVVLKYARHILHLGSATNFFGTTEDYIKSEPERLFGKGGELR